MASKSRDIVNARFGQADRIKVSRKFYQHDIESCILNGRSEAIEEVLNKHNSEPFNNVSELIGELQIMLVKNWNDFHKMYPLQTRPITVERILKEQGYL
jgi:hypothetical protein